MRHNASQSIVVEFGINLGASAPSAACAARLSAESVGQRERNRETK